MLYQGYGMQRRAYGEGQSFSGRAAGHLQPVVRRRAGHRRVEGEAERQRLVDDDGPRR
jgi:hypothetical protein